MTRIALDLVDCPDRRLTRAAIDLVARDVADGQTEVSVLLPDRKYRGLWHRILHDQTAEAIERDVSQLPHANVTTVPFHFETRARTRNRVPSRRAVVRPTGRTAAQPHHTMERWPGQRPRALGRRRDPDRRRPVAPAGHHRGTCSHGAGPTDGRHPRLRVRRRGCHRRDVHHLPWSQPRRRHRGRDSPASRGPGRRTQGPTRHLQPVVHVARRRASTVGEVDGQRESASRSPLVGIPDSTPDDRSRCQLRPLHHRGPTCRRSVDPAPRFGPSMSPATTPRPPSLQPAGSSTASRASTSPT